MVKKITFFMLIIIAIFANTALASVGTIDKTLYYTGITINIDNTIINPKDVNGNIVEPFIIDGTTYLPVRAISEALGKNVTWNGETYSVYIADSNENKTQNTDGKTDKKIYEKVKTLNYKDIKIYINQKLIEPKDANGNIAEPFIIDGTTYLPVRAVAEAFNKNVDWKDETKTVIISSKEETNKIAKINDVVVKVINNTLCTEIKADTSIKKYNAYLIAEGTVIAEPYLNMRESATTNASVITTIPNEANVEISDISNAWYKVSYNGNIGWVSSDYITAINNPRVVIDLENTKFNIETNTEEINYNEIKTIRFGNQGNNVNRIVLDLEKITEFKVVQNSEKTLTYLALNSSFEFSENDKGEEIYVASNDDKIYLPKDEIEKEESEIKKDLASVSSIKYASASNKITIKITGNYDYNIFKLKNPNRIVLDITGAKLNVDGPKEINPNNKNLTQVRFSQNDEEVVRVVFDIVYETTYIINQTAKELTIELEENIVEEEPTEDKNIIYKYNKTYSKLILKDTNIDYFDTSVSSVSNKYTLTFSSKKFDAESETLEFDDKFVEKVVIKSNKITVYGTEDAKYSIKQVGENVEITIKEAKSQNTGDRVILIDAGHGGKDPGACNGSIYEKVYNLKIALKLYDMLKDTEGIDVRISRDDDVYIDRAGRLEFVLDNQDADLFVSIHNNSLANKNYQGSMVLFYNKPGEEEDYGITSKEFATLVKNNLVEDLETIDRGVVSRDDLWVLTQNHLDEMPEWEKTNIPSILCEVIFISNDEEAKRLQTEEFQETTAKAIYDGIIEAISIMDKK